MYAIMNKSYLAFLISDNDEIIILKISSLWNLIPLENFSSWPLIYEYRNTPAERIMKIVFKWLKYQNSKMLGHLGGSVG